MPATERLKQQRHQQLGQMMPATTGTREVLKIFFSYCRNFNREIFWNFFPMYLTGLLLLWQSEALTTRLDLIHNSARSNSHSARSHLQSARSHPFPIVEFLSDSDSQTHQYGECRLPDSTIRGVVNSQY
jgi:hypothetical protein